MGDLKKYDDNRFAANLVHFGRLLRVAGLPIGTGRVLEAVRAVDQVGINNREDFYWTLHSVFVSHPRERLIFNQAFSVFWKNHRLMERSMAVLMPQVKVPDLEDSSQEMARRLSETLYSHELTQDLGIEREPDIELQASLTYSDRERFNNADFESMSQLELEQAKYAITKMRVAFCRIKSRRFQPYKSGNRLDMRKTLKESLKGGADSISLVCCKNKTQPVSVVMLCDISGSMSEYSRMMLHFSHVLMLSRNDVSCFVFGTRLTNITRQLRVRDVDCALSDIAQLVDDWYGGTRIGECLRDFNRNWIRRLAMHNAIVLLVTDGLDRSETGDLESEIQLLQRSCRQLIWLNPLLRYEDFEPRVSGIRTMLPHVDAFYPVHSINSLKRLSEILGAVTNRNEGTLSENQAHWRNKLQVAEKDFASVVGI